MKKIFPAGLALALAAPFAAHADTASDIAAMWQEMQALRTAYEERLQALEQRLRAAEAAAKTPAAPPVVVAAPAAARPVAAAPAAGANAFNPALSLILSGVYTRTTQDPARYAFGGIPMPAGAEAGPGTRGFSLGESELGFAASIDPWWRGVAAIAFHEDSASVEEAYVQTTALGRGLSLKAGRFFSGIGYLNAQHAHVWDFVDNPLAYQALLGTQVGEDGVQLTWLAPTDRYLEFGVEVGRGRSFPGGDNSRNGAGAVALTAHTGGDLGDSHSWRAGLSVLQAKAEEQGLSGLDSAGDGVDSLFSGRTRVWVADAVWKWAPNGNATRTSFKLQGEYVRARREGSLAVSGGDSDAYRAVQSGWYVQAVYQFLPGWRVGLRTERLDPGKPDYGLNAGLLDDSGFKPRKQSLMLDYGASEFSRIRLQLAQDRSRPGAADKQLFVQYQMSLGAHGAHSY